MIVQSFGPLCIQAQTSLGCIHITKGAKLAQQQCIALSVTTYDYCDYYPVVLVRIFE